MLYGGWKTKPVSNTQGYSFPTMIIITWKIYLKQEKRERIFFSATYSFEEKNDLFHHLFENTDFRYAPEKQKAISFRGVN